MTLFWVRAPSQLGVMAASSRHGGGMETAMGSLELTSSNTSRRQRSNRTDKKFQTLKTCLPSKRPPRGCSNPWLGTSIKFRSSWAHSSLKPSRVRAYVTCTFRSVIIISCTLHSSHVLPQSLFLCSWFSCSDPFQLLLVSLPPAFYSQHIFVFK